MGLSPSEQAGRRQMKQGYKFALQWLLDNDDCHWLDDKYGSFSVTLALVADLFGKSTETVTADLRKLRDKKG